ncbi:MAG TPA: hypothetical protein PLD72_01905 [Methanothrix soehngenii]|nr:hypothetical protein [Methanothrix soehngenii]
MKVYRLTISLDQIIEHFEDEKRRESARSWKGSSKLKVFSKGITETPVRPPRMKQTDDKKIDGSGRRDPASFHISTLLASISSL